MLGESGATWITILLICCEGLCGGAAYVNCFYRLGSAADELDEASTEENDGELGGTRIVKDSRRREQEKEFVSFRPVHLYGISFLY